tara:strand:+ start:430 stop:1026 length:597 start_codon:yes stop_codon:yes gene_type:complete
MKSKLSLSLVTALGLAAFSSFTHASHDFGDKHTSIKLLAGANLYEDVHVTETNQTSQDVALATYGVGIEYDLTRTFGVELRHYFGGEEKNISYEVGDTNVNSNVSMDAATALLLNIQSPSFYGASAYLQGGPSIVKSSLNNVGVSNTSFAYGAGLEYIVGKNSFVSLDALIFNEFDATDQSKKSIKNKIITLGFALKF